MNDSNTDIYIMIIIVSIVLVLLLSFTVSFIIIYSNRQSRLQLEMNYIKEQYQQELLKTQLEIKEQTLKNISQEIHDNVGQLLSLAILNLSSLDLDGNMSSSEKVERITTYVEKAVEDLRHLSKTMDPEVITRAGLPTLIRMDVVSIEKTGLFKAELIVTGIEKKLEASKEIIAYRIVQESVNNVLKHSKASELSIKMDYSENYLRICIADNGIGMNLILDKDDSSKIGAGLKNMKNRALLIGALLNFKSIMSIGTEVILEIPL